MTQKIMVQVADRAWTLHAVHEACLLARQTQAEVALMSMVPVQHLSMLGTSFGTMNFDDDLQDVLCDYAETAEDYGIPCSLHVFQYFALADAILEAADHLDAQVVFATLPNAIFPFWRNQQLRRLERNLIDHGRRLINPKFCP